MLAEHPAKAETQAREILKIAPDDPRALLDLGFCAPAPGRSRVGLSRVGASRESLSECRKYALRIGRHFGRPRSVGRGDRRAAPRRNARESRSPGAVAGAGRTAFSRGRHHRGRGGVHRLALRLDPKSCVESRCEIALARPSRRRRKRFALSTFLAHPTDVEALRLMGETLVRLARYADAETLLAYCLQLDPAQDGARLVLRRRTVPPAESCRGKSAGRIPAATRAERSCRSAEPVGRVPWFDRGRRRRRRDLPAPLCRLPETAAHLAQLRSRVTHRWKKPGRGRGLSQMHCVGSEPRRRLLEPREFESHRVHA